MHRGSVDYIESEPWLPPTVFIRQFTESNIATEVISESYFLTHFCEEEETSIEPSKSDIKRFTFLKSSLFCTLLEDAVVQLRCLEQCNNQLKIIKAHADNKHLKTLKFNIKTPVVTDELEGIDSEDLNNTIHKIRKLEADRIYIHDVLLNLYLELAFEATTFTLHEHSQQWHNRAAYRVELAKDEAKNKITRKELSKQLRVQRNHFKSAIYDTNVTIENLKAQVEDSLQISETASRYVVNWQVARTEQHIKTIEKSESRPMATIEYYKQRYDHEVRVHNEIELLVNIVINESLAKVEEWMDHYERDMENIDMKIEVRKHNYADARDRRENMEKMLEKRAKLMKDWINYKDEREKLRLYKIKMTNAAIVVQAWWRGLLVRCKLGPFKEKKKKKGKK